jgi:hypothetical protein
MIAQRLLEDRPAFVKGCYPVLLLTTAPPPRVESAWRAGRYTED